MDYEFQVFEDGEFFAGCSAGDRDSALKEAMHYAAQCDGKVEVYEIHRTYVPL